MLSDSELLVHAIKASNDTIAKDGREWLVFKTILIEKKELYSSIGSEAAILKIWGLFGRTSREIWIIDLFNIFDMNELIS